MKNVVIRLPSGRCVRKLVQDEDAGIEAVVEERRGGEEDGVVEETLPVPLAVMRFLVGKRGSVKSEIERDTHTRISIPPRQTRGEEEIAVDFSDPAAVAMAEASGGGGEGRKRGKKEKVEFGEGMVRIVGREEGVGRAMERCQLIVDDAMSRIPYTHFISIPLVGASDAIAALQREVEAPRKALVSPGQLHLTLCMLRLLTPRAVETAIHALHAASPGLERALRGLRVGLRGFEIMNDDPSAVHVLYMRISEPSPSSSLPVVPSITAAWNCVVSELKKVALLDDDELERQHMRAGDGSFQPKLHATFLNTRLATRDGEDRKTFDASELMEKYDGHLFATTPITSVHLSIRGPFGKDGYYQSAGKVEFDTMGRGE